MWDSHDKLQYGNKYNHWKILELALDLNYFSFSKPNLNQTHLTRHQTLSPNHQFSQRIWYVEHHSVHAHMAWSQKFRLTPAPRPLFLPFCSCVPLQHEFHLTMQIHHHIVIWNYGPVKQRAEQLWHSIQKCWTPFLKRYLFLNNWNVTDYQWFTLIHVSTTSWVFQTFRH